MEKKMDFLQAVAGGFYLLQKIFLSRAERAKLKHKTERVRTLKLWAWTVYPIGLFAWLIIFWHERNWIVGAVEFSGLPSMLLGFYIAFKQLDKKAPEWLFLFALLCAAIGLYISFWDFGGINTLNQYLEIGIAAGYLIGTLFLAIDKPVGYIFYVVMNISCAWLMWRQGYPVLFIQQLTSLIFVLDAYRVSRMQTSTPAT